MTDQEMDPFRAIDAYSLADGARRAGCGHVIDVLRPQGAITTFVGRAVTARICYEPNREIPLRDYGVGALLDRITDADVLVLDGGGLMSTMLGSLAIELLHRNGGAATVVNGLIRDAEEMEDIPHPVFARGIGISSLAGHARIENINDPVHINGATVRSGDLLSGCRGGIVVVPWEERDRVLSESRAVIEADIALRSGIRAGKKFADIWQIHK